MLHTNDVPGISIPPITSELKAFFKKLSVVLVCGYYKKRCAYINTVNQYPYLKQSKARKL